MTPERWQQIKGVLDAAVALRTQDRDAFLTSACAADDDLRREVESLLASHERAGSRFLNEPALSGPAPASAESLAAGGRIGPYLIVESIGRGGMGEVFSAVRADGHFEHTVAVKMIGAGRATSVALERFLAERQILAGLDHPNIARLFDGGATDSGAPYLVMELVDGEPIDAYCRLRSLSIADRLRLFLQVCSAVQYAHQRLVVHRDLKPGNILVTPDGVPKLLDFGIAKVLDPVVGAQETLLRPFTPEYASPEQVRGEPVSTASDVYALGVILFQLLTGRSPYRLQQPTSGALADAITSQEPERPSAVAGAARELRGDLDVILLKALRKEPDRRYSTVEQFADDIRRHLDGEPVAAHKGTWTYVAGKFARRHRTVVAAAALVLATLVAGIIVTAREARIAEANRRRADARFNDVRKLANSLLFEVHDSIANLPGATDARNLILKRSLEYLDGLARESNNESDLVRELAAAYGRIAALQGNASSQNLGQIAAARNSYRKALELRESLAAAHPDDRRDRVELGVQYDEFATFQLSSAGDVASAYAYAKRARAILDREAAATPNDLRVVVSQLHVLVTLAWLEAGEGLMARTGKTADAVADAQRGLDVSERAVVLDPSNVRLQSTKANLEVVLGDALLKLGRRRESLDHYAGALAIYAAVIDRANNFGIMGNNAVVEGKIGDVFIIDGDPAHAASHYQEALRQIVALANRDPHNEFLIQQHAISAVEAGHALVEIGRIDEGLPYMRDALEKIHRMPTPTPLVRSVEVLIRAWLGEGLERAGKIREAAHEYAAGKELLTAERDQPASGARIREYYAVSTDRLGAALAALGDVDGASREYDEAQHVLEPLARDDPEDYEIAYALADTYARQGALAVRSAERARDAGDRLSHWQSARDRFRQSLAIWKTVPNPARISTSGFEVTMPAEVQARLARCEREIAALGGA